MKLVLAVALVVGGIAAFYFFETEWPQLYRSLALIAIVIAAAALAISTARGRSFLGFIRDARTELRKVVWPTRQETMQTTLVVLVIVLIVAIFLWLLDMFLRWGIGRLTGLGE